MQPLAAGRQLVGFDWEARRDEPGREGTLQHVEKSKVTQRLSQQLGALTLQHHVPAIHQFRAFPVAGGLMSYGTDVADAFRLAGAYTGRILKGEKPSNLPVQQATKVELVINMKTAKSLGLTFPLNVLGRADEVIE